MYMCGEVISRQKFYRKVVYGGGGVDVGMPDADNGEVVTCLVKEDREDRRPQYTRAQSQLQFKIITNVWIFSFFER